jgi:DNA-binding Lrp family transcriptional regulator
MDVPSILPLLDPIDQKLLRLLRTDARLSVRGLSREIGMSAGAVGERLERLESRGVIKGYRVDVDAGAIGLEVEALVGVELEAADESLLETLRALPEVVHVDVLTGRWDVLVRVVLRDHPHLKEMLSRPIWRTPGVRRVETMIVLETAS